MEASDEVAPVDPDVERLFATVDLVRRRGGGGRIQRRNNPGRSAPSAPLADGSTAFAGDVVATRRNDRARTDAGQAVRNRHTWEVEAVGADGSLVVSHPARGRARLSACAGSLPGPRPGRRPRRLRQGELFALRWDDVDLGAASIAVRRKRLRLASGEVIEDDPKSRAGRRTIALPAVLVAELECHRARYGADANGYVFTSEEGTPLERSNFRQRVWLPAARAAGLEGMRFHDLRHSAGTLAARTGATTKELMARLGHASPRAAMIYQHAADDRDRRITEGLDAMAEEAGLRPPSP